MNIIKLFVAGGAAAIWGNNYTHGNWVGNNWSAGRRHRDGEPLDESVVAENSVDEAAKKHDIAYNKAYQDHAIGLITAEGKKARERAADGVLLNDLAAIDTSTLTVGAGFAHFLASSYFGLKVFLDDLGAPTLDPNSGAGGAGNPAGALKNMLIEDVESAFDEAEGESPPPPCPLVLDLDGDGTESIALTAGTYFDHAADGFAEATGWGGADDGLLVWDRDSSGRIESGRELFGNETLLQNGQKAANGFIALAEWDVNADGKIDSTDAVWGNLRIWRDAELLSMADAGVVSINLAYSVGTGVDASGNFEWLTGGFTRTDQTTGEVVDYQFPVDTVRTIAEEWLDVAAAIAALPDVSGFGKMYDLHQAMVRDTSGSLQGVVSAFAAETDVADRNVLVDQILYKWAGAESVDPSSRGAFIDARRLVALEAFMGRGFVGTGGTTNPNAGAAPLLNEAYVNLSEQVYAQLMAQTHLRTLYDEITYSWDAVNQRLVGDLSAVKALLESELATDYEGAVVDTVEFIRTVRGLTAESTLPLTAFNSNPALKALLDRSNGYSWLVGGSSADTLSGGGLTDFILGYQGDDTITNGGGNDFIYGGGGNDTVTVHYAGTNWMEGGAGDDLLRVTRIDPQYRDAGYYGAVNTMVGGAGNDRLEGSSGADTYVFNRGDGQDTINDDASGYFNGSYEYSDPDKMVFGAGIAFSDPERDALGGPPDPEGERPEQPGGDRPDHL